MDMVGHWHPGGRRVTIRDVARQVGVSPSTVSRAFSRPGRVGAETARRIHEVSDALGYRTGAVDMVDEPGRITGQVAIVVSDLGNPIFTDLVKSAQHECLRLGYGLLVIDSEESGAIERRSIELVRSHIDGVILGSSRRSDMANRKLAETIAMITINRPIRGIRSVIADTGPGLTEAVTDLSDLGHRDVAYICGPQNSWQEGIRWRVLVQLIGPLGMRLHRIASAAPTYEGGARCVDAVLAGPSTAVVAYNDLLALGLLSALHARGVNVPERLSVVGIDDIPASSLVRPALSTIRLPRGAVAAAAADKLIRSLHRVINPDEFRPVYVRSHYIPRQSTASAHAT